MVVVDDGSPERDKIPLFASPRFLRSAQFPLSHLMVELLPFKVELGLPASGGMSLRPRSVVPDGPLIEEWEGAAS